MNFVQVHHERYDMKPWKLLELDTYREIFLPSIYNKKIKSFIKI